LPYPQPPTGTRLIASGRMGELGTRMALEACLDKEVVRELAPRWAGDAYTIVEGPNRGAISMIWTTAWSGGVSGNVVNLMKLVQPCWQDRPAADPPPPGWPTAGASRLATSAELVSVARGSIALSPAVSRQLSQRVVAPAAVPPLGGVPPPPAPAQPVRI